MANHLKQRRDAEDPDVLQLRDWFAGEKATQIPRRNEIFALLGHYHRTQVLPRLTVRGALVRLWLRLTGQKYHLMDWWELFDARKAEIKARRQAAAQLDRELAGETASEPVEPPHIIPSSRG